MPQRKLFTNYHGLSSRRWFWKQSLILGSWYTNWYYDNCNCVCYLVIVLFISCQRNLKVINQHRMKWNVGQDGVPHGQVIRAGPLSEDNLLSWLILSVSRGGTHDGCCWGGVRVERSLKRCITLLFVCSYGCWCISFLRCGGCGYF